MLDFSDSQGKLRLAIIVVVLLGVLYLLWSRSAPPVPRPAPGQTLENPFGTAPPGPSPSAPFPRR